MRHLSDDELVDLMDGVLPAGRRQHFAGCAACREKGQAFDSVLTRVVDGRGADVPEPSPLFWDHLSARVRDAVAEPAPPAWRDRLWWPRSAWAAGLAAVALAVAVSHSIAPRAPFTAPPPPLVLSGPARAVAATLDRSGDIEADEDWALVRSVADQVAWDDTHAAGIAARPDAAERMALELSTPEQSELARLLRRELDRPGI